ncbi:hypothetical protein FACS1894137_00640 [Spirochaetia bacterium]|nr:hypothetical protein FACS1894137_00640 [Spirochaetia bacterium]
MKLPGVTEGKLPGAAEGKLPGAAEGKVGGPDSPAKAGILPPLPAREASRDHVPQTAALQIAGFKDLARSLGLPQDKLSSSLLSFIRFFSLPLDTKLIQRLRQEVLSLKVPQKDGGPKAGPGKTKPQILDLPPDRIRSGALAAAAAAGKGLALSTEALEKYAAAIAGEESDGGTSGGEGDGAGHKHGKQDGAPDDGAEHTGGQAGGAQTPPHAEDGLSPEQLRDLVEKIEGQSPLLGILNKLPGKDGRRWINLPFSFSSGAIDYSVSLRILLADTNAIPWKAECLALDVASGSSRWSFTLEGSGTPLFARALVGIYPPPEHPAALERDLWELLGTVAGDIVLKDMAEGVFGEGAPFEEVYR